MLVRLVPPVPAIGYTALMRYVSEIELLKLLETGERRQVVARVLSREIDLQALLKFLEDQELAQYFSNRIELLQLGKLFPASFREALGWHREAQSEQRAMLISALEVLHSQFSSAGLEFVLTKGLHIADKYWGGVEARFTWDLDLLVEQSSLVEAICTLERQGYRSAHTGVLGPTFARHFSHAMEFIKQGVVVDLHWIFRPRPGHRLDYQAIWNRRISWGFRGIRYSVLSEEDTLLMLLLGIAQDVERAKPNYRKFWDIYLMLGSGAVLDWDIFFQRASEQGVGRLVVALLVLTCHALDCRDEFPALDLALVAWSRGTPCAADDLDSVLCRSPGALANRFWIARLQPVSTPYYLVWWTVTAPMRYLVWK